MTTVRRVYHLPHRPAVPAEVPPPVQRRLADAVLTAVEHAVRGRAPGGAVRTASGPAASEPPSLLRVGFGDGTYGVPSYGAAGNTAVPALAGYLEDDRLGIIVVGRAELVARISRVLARPGPAAGQARRAHAANPGAARAELLGTHFRDDHERLSYAVGYFQADLGTADSDMVFGALVAYEIEVQSRIAGQVVVSDPPTAAERAQLDRLRQERRTAAAAQRDAEAARRARADLARTPEDITGDPDPAEGGPYRGQGLDLPYARLVPDPDPRTGFDEQEVRRTLTDPDRFEQLYYDATHGIGKAAWLVVQFERKARQDAREAARGYSLLTVRGLAQAFLGTGGFDLSAYGFSTRTMSGRRMYAVFLKEFASASRQVEFSNTVLTNLLAIVEAGRLAKGALPKPQLPAVPREPLPSTPIPAPAPVPAPVPTPPRQIGFRPPGQAPAPVAVDTPPPLSRPVSGFRRPPAPRPVGTAGGSAPVDMPPARVVPGSGPARSGETVMSAGGGPGGEPPRTGPKPVRDTRPQTKAEEDWDRAQAAADKHDPAQQRPTDTEHGSQRKSERGDLTQADQAKLQAAVPRVQGDKAVARVIRSGKGKGNFTVVITNEEGQTVTVMHGKTKEELRGLSDRYEWNPPWE